MTCYHHLPNETFEIILSSCVSETVRLVNKKWKKVIDSYNCKKGLTFILTKKICKSYLSTNPQYFRAVDYFWYGGRMVIGYSRYYKGKEYGCYECCDNIYHKYVPCGCTRLRFRENILLCQLLEDSCCFLDALIYWVKKHYLGSNENFVARSLKAIILPHLDSISGGNNKKEFLSLCEHIAKLNFI
jgi:hypothetical protein